MPDISLSCSDFPKYYDSAILIESDYELASQILERFLKNYYAIEGTFVPFKNPLSFDKCYPVPDFIQEEFNIDEFDWALIGAKWQNQRIYPENSHISDLKPINQTYFFQLGFNKDFLVKEAVNEIVQKNEAGEYEDEDSLIAFDILEQHTLSLQQAGHMQQEGSTDIGINQWRLKNWGTKFEPLKESNYQLPSQTDDNHLLLNILTPDSPPLTLFEKIAYEHGCQVHIHYYEISNDPSLKAGKQFLTTGEAIFSP